MFCCIKKNNIKKNNFDLNLEETIISKYYDNIIEDYKFNDKNLYVCILDNKKIFIKESFYNNNSLNELFFLRKLNHKHIVEYINNFIDNDLLLISMEYYYNDLYNYITINKNINLNYNVIIIIYNQLKEVILYLHNINICHGDIKLENIMIDNDKNIKLIDFEYTREYNDNKTNEKSGTFHYKSPEKMLEDNFNPFKAELWSLGICIYLLSEYKYPYFGNLKFLKTNTSNKKIIRTEFDKKLEFNSTSEKIKIIIINLLNQIVEKRILL